MFQELFTRRDKDTIKTGLREGQTTNLNALG
jgi:hypothetical protein